MKPWQIQKQNDNMNLNMPSIKKMISLIGSIPYVDHRALVGMVYLTGGRISELIRSDRYGRYLPSIKRKQIQIDEHEGHKILKISFRTLKKRGERRDTSYRVIPVPLDIEINKEIVALIWPYLKDLNPEEELFPIKYTQAYNLIRKYTGWNCHWIRHIRTYHLLTVIGLKEELIRIYMGWTDLRPLSRYSSLK